MFRIGVLVSGSGSNLQSIIDGIENGNINAEIACVISDKENAFGLERARKHNIKAIAFDKKKYKDVLNEKIYEVLKEEKVDLVVLAGYLSILDGEILKSYNNKIINIHPSLIPSFCGPNMYGIKVHEAAIKKGVRYSGCTVHFVNEEVDGGAIILQQAVDVYFEDDAETLQKRILEKEHILLPKAIKLISEGKVEVIDGRCRINK